MTTDSTKADASVSRDQTVDVRFRMRISHDDRIAIGPGKVLLLEAVQQCGSITAAAKHLGMSYRRAWLLIDELNRCLTSPATVSSHGGNARGSCVLTPVGEQIVRLYREIEALAQRSCESHIGELTALMKTASSAAAEV